MPDHRSDAELTAVVQRFVMRARRILAHSLCDDDEALKALSDGAFLVAKRDGVLSLERRLPDEESLESLAARVRPLMLQNDGVHHSAVLNALSSYLSRRGLDDDVAWCRDRKKEWKSVDLSSGAVGYSLSVSTKESLGQPHQITDVALAGTWFYGDLVHADEGMIDQGSPFDLHQRFAAAAVRTAQIAVLTRELLSFVLYLVDGEVIGLDDDVLTAPVKVEPKVYEQTRVWTAPLGTEVDEAVAGAPLGDQWDSGLPGHIDGDGPWVMRIPWGGQD